MNNLRKLDRRSFLKVAMGTGGTIVFGVSLSACDTAEPRAIGNTQKIDDFRPNAFLKIAPNGYITVVIPAVEMGQGVMTSLAMLVADEMEADWRHVTAEFAPADPGYVNPRSGQQLTGGSSSVRGFFTPIREASAAAREMLVEAAARRLDVPVQECNADSHAVIHRRSGRRIGFGDLVTDAAQSSIPETVFLKTPDMFRYIGKPMPRLDTPDKVRGFAVFGQDVRVPGMQIAMVERAPAFGAKLTRFDAVAAYRTTGVHKVFPIESGVAIVGDSFDTVRRARKVLRTEWSKPRKPLDDRSIEARLTRGLEKAKIVRQAGDAEGHLSKGTVEAEYHVPYQAHACMEPMNCTVRINGDGCDIWVGTQAPARTQKTAMDLTGLPQEAVRVHSLYLGGGFGRRAEQDFITEAIQISQTTGAPVKLMWTREDDMRHDYYRPVSRHRLRASFDGNGLPLAWEHRIASPSILARLMGKRPRKKPDPTSLEGAVNIPYAIPHLRVGYAQVDMDVPVGFWRSVGSSQNAFVTECFLDEIAKKAGRDPYLLRFELLRDKPRHREVLALAAEKAGWGGPLPEGHAQGIAVAECFGSFVAQVAEVSITASQVRVHRMVCAVDCGLVVNPDTVVAQIEGGIIYGLTAALKGAVSIANGGVKQENFSDYPLLRMDETPDIRVYIIPSDEPPGGVGEPGVPPAAPAVANAVFALTGHPVRQLPINLTGERKRTTA